MGDDGDAEVGDQASLLLGDMRGDGLIERSRCGRCLAGVVMPLGSCCALNESKAGVIVIGETFVRRDRC